jgi:GT2 family glycosyltransferase
VRPYTAAPVAAAGFSVVVPTVGRARYLEGCLDALAGLSSPRGGFEVIVVDDSGGGEIEPVVARAPGLEPRLVSTNRSGPSTARNAGARAATGTYVAFTDDDCRPRADWLVELERALADAPEAAVGGTTANGVPHCPGSVASQLVVDALHAQFNRGDAPRFFASQNLAVPAAGFAEIGGFDERLRYGEDRELCERWASTGRRLVAAPAAVVDHMRVLPLRDFWRQHYGYGRGAWSFARMRRETTAGHGDTFGVLRRLAELTRRQPEHRGRVAGYVALSQLATTAGFLRQALDERSAPA